MIEITEKTSLQSPHIYLQSAGSTGNDSTKGIHLRWMLKNGLSAHLPKADYATPGVNFNKNGDYVNIYRAPYTDQRKQVTVDFSVAPGQVNDNGLRWGYAVNGRMFYVIFFDGPLYAQVRTTVNPGQNPQDFISNYFQAGGVIEVECPNELCFSVTTSFSAASTATVKTELLSVEENTPSGTKKATLRKTFSLSQVNNKKLFSENIRSIRLQCTNTFPRSVSFELYYDLVADRKTEWTLLGKHALTLNDTIAFQRLEPVTNIVNGRWLRYNDEALVNIRNYKERWNGDSVSTENRIKEGVQRYIQLSNAADNPMALETFSYDPVEGPGGQDAASEFEISNLHLLLMGSMDYHIARMLGLGLLDFGGSLENGQFIYLAEYVTFGDLNDGLGPREVHHLYCSLPTALTDQRLPLPVDLKEPEPGIFTSNMIESTASITDADGYSHDGRTRFISLFNEDLPEEEENAAFFYKNYEFISADNTLPVYAGIEYRQQGAPQWRKPELSFNSAYENIDATVGSSYEKRETVSIVIPDPGNALFVHREKHSGWHEYSSYGINWFSRATSSSVIHNIETQITPSNDLLPPTNINTVLIQKENPLLLTSSLEQDKYDAISQTDKTLVRLTFEYDHGQELIDYQQKIGNELIDGYTEIPDNEELFAEDIEIFFRNRTPHTVSGKILSVANHSNPLLAVVTTVPYELVSTGQEDPVVENQVIIPAIPSGTNVNYIGSILVVEGFEYIIQSVDTSGNYPEFTIFKRAVSGAIIDEQTTTIPDEDLEAPDEGVLFLLVENMQNGSSWQGGGITNPSAFRVEIDHTTIHREQVKIVNPDNIPETHVQKFRGIYRNAVIKKFLEEAEEYVDGQQEPEIVLKHLGLYEISFPGFYMAQHSQYTQGDDSVEFYNGIVRIHTLSDPQGVRKVFKVINSKNIGQSGEELILYVSDLSFPADEAEQASYDGKIIPEGQSTVNQTINYYPGYKVYLYQDSASGLTSDNILPQGEEEDLRYSVFSLRSHDNMYDYNSKLSVPTLMFAKAIREPKPPKQPLGGLYATRPDYFGKATYTFTTEFESGHKPYAIQFGRASDIQLLSAVYNRSGQGEELSTVAHIMQNIFLNGEEEFYVNRWKNFLSFSYTDGHFEKFPDAQGNALPLPDSPDFIEAINIFIDNHNTFYANEPDVEHIDAITSLNQEIIPATSAHGKLLIKDFFKDAILNCFIPLTEVPVIFKHIKGTEYTPVPKKQKVRDRNGNLLNPADLEFDMAPMMKILEQNPYVTQFTDFGLDGASNAKYFYAGKEMNMQMKSSDYSPILGPIIMVNTSPAASPDVVKVISVLENEALGITPAIEFTINAYPKAQHIQKINLYRTSNAADSLSIRTMQLVKTIDLTEAMLSQPQWVFQDDFADLGYAPYGDPLFYRITVSRQVRYNDSTGALIIDYAPSETSKVLMTNVVNNTIPDSPVMQYYSEPISQGILNSVILSWNRTVYNGKYHLYKMNSQGNWVKVETITSNQEEVFYSVGNLTVFETDGNHIYHHYKVLAENFSGMISTQENILTIYSEESWQDIGGIGDMIVGGTFLIR